MVKIEILVEEKELLILKEKSKDLGFNTVQEYIKFVLEQATEEDSVENVDEEEEKEVREKLKDLGYL